MHICETQRLIIRPFNIQDASLLYQYSNEDEAIRELPDEVLESVDAAKKEILLFNDQFHNHEISVYAIALKSSNILIGHIGLSTISQGIEIGYAIAEKFQGQGYCSEIVLPFSLWAKTTFGIDTLYGIVKSANIPSIKALEKSGYRLAKESEFIWWGKPHLTKLYTL